MPGQELAGEVALDVKELALFGGLLEGDMAGAAVRDPVLLTHYKCHRGTYELIKRRKTVRQISDLPYNSSTGNPNPRSISHGNWRGLMLNVRSFLVVGLLGLSALTLSAGEVLTNPGFETGSLGPWFVGRNFGATENWNVTSTVSHSGTFSATDVGNQELEQTFAGVQIGRAHV